MAMERGMPENALNPRNTLWLLAALAAVCAPHIERLSWWAVMLAVTVIVWRSYLGFVRLPLPRAWLLFLIVIGAVAAVYLQHGTLFGRDAGVVLLIVMVVLKTLETKSTRDAMLLIVLCYFLILAGFLYSQTIPTAIYMLSCVWIITATMIRLNHTPPLPSYRHQLRSSAVLLAQSAPLMLALFVFFPRVQGPLWGLPQDAYSGVSGLSDSMSPGTLTNLILSDAVAFRVAFSSPVPPPKALYWRGPVLRDFDGQTWTAPRARFRDLQYQAIGAPVEYEVTIEPSNKRWLFALDLPGRVPPRAAVTSDFQLMSNSPITNRLRYGMESYLDARYGRTESEASLQRALQLPAGFNPRTVELGKSLRRKFSDDNALVRHVLSMFRNENFVYTTSPPLLGRDSIDEFLFVTRSGFCEHYASAFTVLMRAAGVPARVVTGYQGGELNPLGHYMIVRQADAHAWTEAWLRDAGWVRVDPTAAVSPLRVEAGIAAAIPRRGALPLFARGDLQWQRQLRLTWDSIANAWNQWVLGYNPERQRVLLSRVGFSDATWRLMALALVCVTGLITLTLSLIMLRKLRIAVRDPVKRAYLKFCGKLARKGLPRELFEGPLDYADRLARIRPDLAPAISIITDLYVSLHYGIAQPPLRLGELLTQIKKFHP